MFGYQVGNIQHDISIADNEITGTLQNLDGSLWEAGTWSANEKDGYFIALKVTNVPDAAVVTVELVNGLHGPTTLDSDRNIVIRVSSTNYSEDIVNRSIKVVATYNGDRIEKVYGLQGLEFDPEQAAL